MEMIQIFEVDKKGNIISSAIEPEDFQETKYFKRGWEDYLLSPKFNFIENRWVESATNEELENANAEVESSSQLLAQSVSDLEINDIEKDIKLNTLEKQNEELGQQLSDLEIQILGGM